MKKISSLFIVAGLCISVTGSAKAKSHHEDELACIQKMNDKNRDRFTSNFFKTFARFSDGATIATNTGDILFPGKNADELGALLYSEKKLFFIPLLPNAQTTTKEYKKDGKWEDFSSEWENEAITTKEYRFSIKKPKDMNISATVYSNSNEDAEVTSETPDPFCALKDLPKIRYMSLDNPISIDEGQTTSHPYPELDQDKIVKLKSDDTPLQSKINKILSSYSDLYKYYASKKTKEDGKISKRSTVLKTKEAEYKLPPEPEGGDDEGTETYTKRKELKNEKYKIKKDQEALETDIRKIHQQMLSILDVCNNIDSEEIKSTINNEKTELADLKPADLKRTKD